MTAQEIQVQTCQSAEEIHPLWRDLSNRKTRGLIGLGQGGKWYELRDRHGVGVPVGAQVREYHRSEYTTVLGGGAPALGGGSGRVSVDHGTYSPSVFGLRWVEVV